MFKEKIREKVVSHEVSAVLLMIIALIILFFLSFLFGRYPLSLNEVVLAVASKLGLINFTLPPAVDTIIFQIRFPRIVAAMMIGAALSIAGASFQGLFQNPLVSPDKLGVSAGAGFGASLAILFSASVFMTQISAFAWGLVAVGLTYFIARAFKGTSMLTLVLCGIAIASLFSALLSLIKYVADPYGQLQTIVFWLMGSLAAVNNQDLIIMGVPIVIGTAILLMVRWRINVISMGEEEAQTLGINTRRMQGLIIVCCTVVTASSISICGIIGWIGLVIPHITRMIVGPDHKVLLPASIVLGAFFLLLIDDVARTLVTVEIPLGILTALIGAPFFLYLLMKSREVWS
ncbi:FecCD family ABC transporter permease [Methanobacterium aggregans]|uniref:FecCD family ABC transporter permease n=1 Tax=Methanobacterium aggregans TaxID=1615586 RepID=UPI001FDAACBE|nr:iron ABC transporter permease [Methanobacterium aggregans]MBP2046993.1 iron complex transport system permease protein [Methanobacterium aggregans]